jgi:N-acetylmuramoyl-L-alanine amidase
MMRPHRMLLLSALVLVAAGLVAAIADRSEGRSSVFERPGAPVAVAPPPEQEPVPEPASEVVETEPEVTAPSTTAIGLPAIAPHPDVRAVRTPSGLVLPVIGGEAGAWEVMTPCAATAVVGGEPVLGAHVVLDPGHGGNEPGAVGPSGLREADVNLDIALRVRDLLQAEGTDVVLTRDRDIRLTLATRAAIARATSPLAFVSIHHNAAPVGRTPVPGSELYHQLASPESRRLAGLLWEELQAHLSPYGDDWAAGLG